mgnify:CR=1 FL=1
MDANQEWGEATSLNINNTESRRIAQAKLDADKEAFFRKGGCITTSPENSSVINTFNNQKKKRASDHFK